MRKLIGFVLFFLCSNLWAATCKITEYSDVINVNIPAAHDDGSRTTQSVTYDAANSSAPFQQSTRFIRVVCDAKGHFVISAAGTAATANSPYVPADTPEYFGVQGGHVINFYDGSS